MCWCVDVVCRRQRDAPDHDGREIAFTARSADAGAAGWAVEKYLLG